MSAGTDPGALLTRYVVAGDGRDVAAVRAVVSPEVVVHLSGGGRAGLEQLLGSWAAAHAGLRGLHHDVQEVLATGTSAAARVVATGTHAGPFLGVAATGRVLQVEQALFVRVAGGRIVELWEVVDTGAGLRQLGLLGEQALNP